MMKPWEETWDVCKDDRGDLCLMNEHDVPVVNGECANGKRPARLDRMSLMAAAPDLYRALEAALEAMRIHGLAWEPPWEEALRKARGER